MDHTQLLRYAEEVPLDDGNLADFLDVVSRRLDQHRLSNHGWTPSPLFVPCIRFGGAGVVSDLVVSVYDSHGDRLGFALKKRGAGENGWEGQFHIIGTPHSRLDDEGSIFRKFAKELYGAPEKWQELLSAAMHVGQEVHDEDRRGVVCWTDTFELRISERALAELTGEWRIFTEGGFGDETIIDHHRPVLRWMADPNRPERVDLRFDVRYRSR